jgi:hypothetical protein
MDGLFTRPLPRGILAACVIAAAAFGDRSEPAGAVGPERENASEPDRAALESIAERAGIAR